MSTRRQVVPAALHSELTEYSSLLRALQTSNTLDVTSHLLPASWKGKERARDIEDDEDDVEADYDHPRTRSLSRMSTDQASSSAFVVPSSPSSRERSTSSRLKRTTPRESWTRWPLLEGDVYVPEWSWDEEIAAMASQLLNRAEHHDIPTLPPSPITPDDPIVSPTGRTIGSSQAAIIMSSPTNLSDDTSSPDPTQEPPETSQPDPEYEDDRDSNEDSEDETPFPPAYLSALSQESATFMSQILALLAAHTPLRPGSLQNRIGTLSWRNVVDILAVSGIDGVDGSMLRNMNSKLENIYGPYERAGIAEQRADMHFTAPFTVDTRLSQDPLVELLDLPPMPPGWQLPDIADGAVAGRRGASSTRTSGGSRKRKPQTVLEPTATKRRRTAPVKKAPAAVKKVKGPEAKKTMGSAAQKLTARESKNVDQERAEADGEEPEEEDAVEDKFEPHTLPDLPLIGTQDTFPPLSQILDRRSELLPPQAVPGSSRHRSSSAPRAQDAKTRAQDAKTRAQDATTRDRNDGHGSYDNGNGSSEDEVQAQLDRRSGSLDSDAPLASQVLGRQPSSRSRGAKEADQAAVKDVSGRAASGKGRATSTRGHATTKGRTAPTMGRTTRSTTARAPAASTSARAPATSTSTGKKRKPRIVSKAIIEDSGSDPE
ncbi:hypothetical protein BD626DRAFT_168017 [Schizophyllum amplum]|uniref:Uncharacterized protein n=1 Tax=Schizophyllum amplum TaxID=97359 RepID=A0A550CQE6_9AGAR|nr:hypothetical protein BD626DRAFT_168017 [Auriculariopsis ampla]